MTRTTVFAAAFAAGLGLAAGSAGAEPTSSRSVNAASYGTVDRDQAVEVVLYDASAEAEDLADRLRAALRSAGWQLAEGAPLRLGFVVTSDLSAGQSGTGPVSVEATSNTNIDTQYRAHVRVYSSAQSSVVGGKSGRTPGGATARIQLELSESASGKRLWDGWATKTLDGQSPMQAAATLVPDLVPLIGKTASASSSATASGSGAASTSVTVGTDGQ